MNARGGSVQAGVPRSAFRFRPQLEILEGRSLPSDLFSHFPSLSLVFSASSLSMRVTDSLPTSATLVRFQAAAAAAVTKTSETTTNSPAEVSAPRSNALFGETARVIIVGFHTAPGAAWTQTIGHRQFLTVSTTLSVSGDVSGGAPTEDTRIVSFSVASAQPGPGIAKGASTPKASPTAETPLFVNGVPAGQVSMPSSAGGHSSAPVQIPGPYAASYSARASFSADAPITGSPGIGARAAETPGPTATSSMIDQFPGSAADSSPADEKDASAAPAAAHRKALALGLRYLYPNMTDDEIAQAARVSRRTLFRWDEYVTIKKALRGGHRRRRGFKDRQGNLEAWIDDDE
jgi:hypothetical protein